VAVSAFSARQVHMRAPAVATRVRIVPTGVDTGYFRPPEGKNAAKLAIGRSPSQFLVLGVGRLVAVKQFDRLIAAFASARRAGLDARLVLAGDGPERLRLESLISRLGVADCVDLEGYCDPPRLRALIQAADLQVCSSAFENFSLAILEGMACGTPVLGTPGGGTPELVGAVDASLVLPDDAPGTMAAALCQLADDRSALHRLGVRARAVAAERYDWDRVVDQLESVCAEVTPACM
jgi:glycosyltransferase involved in cell wall biosynthesis